MNGLDTLSRGAWRGYCVVVNNLASLMCMLDGTFCACELGRILDVDGSFQS